MQRTHDFEWRPPPPPAAQTASASLLGATASWAVAASALAAALATLGARAWRRRRSPSGHEALKVDEPACGSEPPMGTWPATWPAAVLGQPHSAHWPEETDHADHHLHTWSASEAHAHLPMGLQHLPMGLAQPQWGAPPQQPGWGEEAFI